MTSGIQCTGDPDQVRSADPGRDAPDGTVPGRDRKALDRPSGPQSDLELKLHLATYQLVAPFLADFVLAGIESMLKQRRSKALFGVEAIQASREAGAALHDAVNGIEARQAAAMARTLSERPELPAYIARATASARLTRVLSDRPELAAYIADSIDVALANHRLRARSSKLIPFSASAARDQLRVWHRGTIGSEREARPEPHHDPRGSGGRIVPLGKGPPEVEHVPFFHSQDRGRCR